MANNLLVCGGLPRSATTFLHNELMNYSNVFRSRIKESFLFNRSESFIDWKLKLLSARHVYLDFTPEYIFDKSAIKKIEDRRIKCFFVLRGYDDYRRSLEQYLSINNINNPFLKDMSRAHFDDSVGYAREHFTCFQFEDVCRNPGSIIARLQQRFELEFGDIIQTGHRENRNSSKRRIYHILSAIQNNLESPVNFTKSVLFGLA